MKKGLLLLIVLLNISCKSKYSGPIENTVIKEYPAIKVDKYKEIQEHAKKLFINIENTKFILDYFDLENYQNNMNGIGAIIKLFNGYEELVSDGENSPIDSVKLRAKLLSKKISDVRNDVWPKLRRKFGQVLAKEVWIHDMYITTKGPRNTIIEFTSLEYSLNKNIKKTQDDMSLIFHELRFKKVIYKTSKYDEEYTFYDIKSKNDSD